MHQEKKKISIIDMLQLMAKGGFILARSRKEYRLPSRASVVQFGLLRRGQGLHLSLMRGHASVTVELSLEGAEVEVSFHKKHVHRIWIRTPKECFERIKASEGGGYRVDIRPTLLLEFRHNGTDEKCLAEKLGPPRPVDAPLDPETEAVVSAIMRTIFPPNHPALAQE